MAESVLTFSMLLAAGALLFDLIMLCNRRKPTPFRYVTVIAPTGNAESLEGVLLSSFLRLRDDFDGRGNLFFTSDGADKEEITIAEKFCADHSGAYVVSLEELRDIIGEQVYKTASFVLY